jgi:uncharacterized protein YllA (UPF0747 family)
MEKYLSKKKIKTAKMKTEMVQYESKKMLLDQYSHNFGIRLSANEENKLVKQLDDVGLELVLKKKLANKKQYIAAQTIQALFRGYICRKWYKRVHEIRTIVAIKLQRVWRYYYKYTVVPRN